MASTPKPLRTARSFPRPEPPSTSPDHARPKRASTLQNGSSPTASKTQPKPQDADDAPDTFVSRISEEATEPPRASVDLDDIPIEVISVADRFIEQLSAKVHPTPPNIDNLARMFQEFYATSAHHIQTHIDSLATRQKRDAPVGPGSTRAMLRAKAASIGNKDKAKPGPVRRDSEMLTVDEYADRRKARKLLEQKRLLMEEAVERRLCEGVYDKIYRHRTTQDEAQDDKLRSKTAALSVVGIGPADLGVDLGGDPDPEAVAKRQQEVKESLEEARKELVLMNESRYPLGKLNHLKLAHKAIIDTLSRFHPSSSADELMPMLIYTLITLPPQNLNVISDVNFIHRFRWEPKLSGELAYCLTTLEATIGFLDTVDLSTLRADEAPAGPLKSATGAPKAETFPPAYSPGSATATSGLPDTTAATGTTAKTPTPSTTAGLRAAVQLRNRRLSDLVNTPAQAFNAASDAVLLTADQGLKTIGASLGDSYKFFLGKLREDPKGLATGQGGEVLVPKTLDDARRLMGTPPPPGNDDGDGESVSGASSVHSPEETTDQGLLKPSAREDRVLGLITGGRKPPARDHSADSARSGGSARRALPGGVEDRSTTPASALDSVRNLGSSFNPMARLSAGLRGFGRTASTPAPTATATAVKGVADGGDLATAFPDIAAVLPPKEAPKFDPPVKRFMELQNPADLRLGEVLELLRDYRRLAGAMKELGAFKE
ncbi:hypothetical protein QBC39DRAFT_166445 [Podospora conica]|nr:hypothetical protein QBC39DRAFT_166445 [Schizothecium conicum]